MKNEDNGFILASCGLVCSQCGAYLKGRCEGCHSERPMSLHCRIKPCVKDKGIDSCAECDEYEDLRKCKKLHNLISIVFGFIFRTNRIGNCYRIREAGVDKFREEVIQSI